MADLFSLLQDLGDRIANKDGSSSSTQQEDDDPVESRFRAVLPTLLEAYFLPDKAKEREVMAILKLLKHTVRHFPGVLFHGKANAVMPVIGRIIPLLAEPILSCGCSDFVLETLESLLALLLSKEPHVFCKFVVDAMLLVQDLVSVASFFSTATSINASTSISVQCFLAAFSGLTEEELFCAAPFCCKDPNSPGLVIDVTGMPRWEPLAECVIKLLNWLLVEKSLMVQGLFTSPFFVAVGKITCYGSSSLHKVCFELVHTATSLLDADIMQREKFILSILAIFAVNTDLLPPYRTALYDSVLGLCLFSLYATSRKEVVEFTAKAFLDIFASTLRSTSSCELKVALCNVLGVILKECPVYSRDVFSFLDLIFIPDIISPLSSCLEVAVDNQINFKNFDSPFTDECNRVKRRKLNTEKEVKPEFSEPLLRICGVLATSSMPLDNVLAGYCVLARVSKNRRVDGLYGQVYKQFTSWLSSLHAEGFVAVSEHQLRLLLETVEGFLFPQDCIASGFLEVVLEVLRLPWGDNYEGSGTIWKEKQLAISIITKACDPDVLALDSILELGLGDEDVRVKAAAISSVPLLLNLAKPDRVITISELLRGLDTGQEQVRETLAAVVGPLCCICGAKFSTSTVSVQIQQNVEIICSICDKEAPLQELLSEEQSSWSYIDLWGEVTFSLLFADCQFQPVLVRNLYRLASHSSEQELTRLKAMWLKCLEVLPVHQSRSVREAFASQIHCFIEERFWHCTSGSTAESSNGGFEVLGKLRHAMLVTKDPEVVMTLMETVAELAKCAKGDQLRVFAAVLLIEHLDYRDMTVRVAAVHLINEVTALKWPLQGEIDSTWKGVFEYLCGRLVTRPVIVKEFAEAVLKVSKRAFLSQVIPVVLPKLVLEQQHDPKAMETLNVLAREVETTVPLLLLEWCHKVLSVLLLRADGKELMAALHFYESQTGSDPREIFAAVLPALLDELVRLLGDASSDEALKRSARVGPMIQEVARIVSGSDDLSGFLGRHFVGLLNSIDRKLLRSEDVGCQKQALRCIERLLDMIGPHLSAFVPKIMALLSQAVQQDGLQSESFRVWLSFVKRLADVCPTSLKNVASQVVVSLMPCLESDKDSAVTGAAEILEELVINRRGVLDDQLRELPLLPSLPALAGVNAILNHVRGSFRLREQILRASDGLIHENLSLRYVTATELLKVLGSKRNEILDMVLAETPSDADAVNRLVTALLRGCAEESRTLVSQKFKLACAECLGGLGAIDPVKLQVSLRHRSRMEHNDENFVFELINVHLTRVLRAASDTDVQDAAALAIQELLKLTGCKEARVAESRAAKNSKSNQQEQLSSCGNSLWNRFSDDVKEIITPCLTSKYLLKISGGAMPSGPIFRRGLSFRRWMYLWTRRLLSQVTGRRSSIFSACQGVIRHDMDTALFLLPHLILDVLCNASAEARSCITEEILTVLSESVSAGEVHDASQPVLINNTFFGHGEVSIQAIFMLLDNLGQWVDDFQEGAAIIHSVQTSKPRAVNRSSAQLREGSLQLHHVTQLLAAIPKQSLAGASFRCRAYARALLYYESYVREKSGALNPAASASGASFEDGDIGFLLKIYAGLDEPDGLSGLAQLQKRATLQDQVLINEKSGNWAEALTCCEQGLQMEPRSLSWHLGALNCLVNMGHFQAMVCHVDGLTARIPEHKRDWSIRGVQAAWRLGQWDLLDEYVQGAELENGAATAAYATETDALFDLGLAKVLQAFRSKDQFKLSEQLTHSRLALLAPLAAACMESYTRAYPFIVKLHMLRELEDFLSLVAAPSEQMLELIETWNGRLKMTQPSLWIREPILALRRLLFTSAGMKSEIGACWLQYAKLCRSSGHYETANRAILQAQAAASPNAHRERARLLWDTKNSHRAMDELQQYLTGVPLPVLGNASAAALGGLVHKTPTPAFVEECSSADNNNVAKALLLLGRWAHQTGQKQKEDVISIYLRVKDLRPTWEKGYFYMAKYSDDLLVDAKRRQEGLGRGKTAEDSAWWNYMPDVILYYAKSLFRSHRHLFQALPRMLTLWFEFGSEMRQATGRRKSVHGRVMSIMKGCLKDLPSYHWVASLPQLVSRICHNNDEVVSLVKMIITTVLKTYPQQALWTMAAVSNSAVVERHKAAAQCIQSAKSSDRNVFNQFTAFIEQMIRLCFIDVPEKVQTLKLSTSICSSLKRSMPLRVIVPVQRALTLTLPADGLTTNNFNPFPDCPMIEAIRDEVQVLVSLQRPKRVVLVASDGTLHPFLCKPQDDLRKDARMMEFTTMINRLLAKDPRSRRRKLYIRTFAVIPLAENCGMVEWVPRTRGLRHILQDLYAACGKFDRETTNNKIKDMYEKSKLSGGDLLRQILPQFPPVFHKWFLNTFPEPTAWFQARLAYAHTAAVWSMVGHMAGLGDRHGENILCDSTTGDCVHVDFSCLFDRGLLLEKPEVVPFRLTQNMVDGLGITGYEGAFLRTCELTLSILRSHRETLMSILETFIHDPLVEWTKSHKLSGTEVQNPHAQRALANIEARLRGVVVGVGAAPSLPLSVEGQAHRLISEAVCVDNLGRMYIWWMAWF